MDVSLNVSLLHMQKEEGERVPGGRAMRGGVGAEHRRTYNYNMRSAFYKCVGLFEHLICAGSCAGSTAERRKVSSFFQHAAEEAVDEPGFRPRPGWEPCILHLLSVGPEAGGLASLSLSFFLRGLF